MFQIESWNTCRIECQKKGLNSKTGIPWWGSHEAKMGKVFFGLTWNVIHCHNSYPVQLITVFHCRSVVPGSQFVNGRCPKAWLQALWIGEQLQPVQHVCPGHQKYGEMVPGELWQRVHPGRSVRHRILLVASRQSRDHLGLCRRALPCYVWIFGLAAVRRLVRFSLDAKLRLVTEWLSMGIPIRLPVARHNPWANNTPVSIIQFCYVLLNSYPSRPSHIFDTAIYFMAEVNHSGRDMFIYLVGWYPFGWNSNFQGGTFSCTEELPQLVR